MTIDVQATDLAADDRPLRALILGANGELGGRKMKASYDFGTNTGTEFVGADIVDESQFKPIFSNFSGYHNLTRQRDRDKLIELARGRRFDFIYDASWPDGHLLNVLNCEVLAQHIVVTKPFVSIEQAATLGAFMESAAFQSLRGRLLMHDHYINKPAMMAMLKALPKAHNRYARFARIMIFITEQRTVNHPQELKRWRALLGGIVPDLVSHALMIIQLLTREGLVWTGQEGITFKRFRRTIQPTACVRAQMRGAALPQDVDTACVVEYKVTEELGIVDEAGASEGVTFTNTFFVLVVCGKGLKVTDHADRDLKAMEIAFQGQGSSTGILDLETNCVNELLETAGVAVPAKQRIHRGINYPIMAILKNWPQFENGDQLRTDLFQDMEVTWENVRLLAVTRNRCKGGLLPAYDPGEEIHKFVNTHIGPANGFEYFGKEGSGWPMKEPPLHLMRGRPVSSSIA